MWQLSAYREGTTEKGKPVKTHPYADTRPIPLQDPDARAAVDRLHGLYYGANPYTVHAMREAITELAAHYGLQVVDTTPISDLIPNTPEGGDAA